MRWLQHAQTNQSLFVHFDKNVYSNNETVYFTGYLLNADSITTNQHQVMAVALVREADSLVISQDKFYMKDGLVFGNLTISDKILTGNYYFVAYTDQIINGMPKLVFTQPITIKTAADPPFNARITLLNDPKSNSKEKKVLIAVTSKEGRFLKNPINISYKYNHYTGSAKADKSGQLIIVLPNSKDLSNPNIQVKVKYEKDSTFINMPIPQPKSKASVRFFPEGGNMVIDLPSVVAWEAKDQQKLPLLVKALLYKDDEIIGNIETSNYGIGKFKIVPKANSVYKIKLIHSSLVDSVYLLPDALSKGVVINLNKAVVADTLKLSISNNSLEKINIRVHNFKNSYLTVPHTMTSNMQLFKIPLTEVSKGLATITVTDSLDRPLSERMFFAHYNKKEQLVISTDKALYKQRERINLKVNLSNPNQDAIVSIACVQNSRLSIKNMQDIVNYTYLTNELKQLPQHLNGNGLADLQYLEQILLVKGWRRYNWQDLERASEKLAEIKTDTLKFTGKLIHYKKNVKVESLITYGSPRPLMIPLDIDGNFHLNSNQMVEKPGTRLYFLLNNKDRIKLNHDYQIELNDPYPLTTKKLAKTLNRETQIVPSALPNNSELVLKNNERIIKLKEVIIGNKNDYIIANECGDYVCTYKILNCINHIRHSQNRLPVIGHSYIAYPGRPEMIIYKGCDEKNEAGFYKAKPVYLSKEFYLSDYKDPLEPAYFSTIYWNYGLILNGDKEVNLDFYSSDITGKFRVVFQGISNKGTVYGEHFFEVK